MARSDLIRLAAARRHRGFPDRASECFGILLDGGSGDLRAQDEQGRTPGHFAAYSANVDALKHIVTVHPGGISAVDAAGRTMLHSVVDGAKMRGGQHAPPLVGCLSWVSSC